MLSEYDPRTAANMEVALQRACSQLPSTLAEHHEIRAAIARAIIACVDDSKPSLVAMTAVGRHAAMEIAARSGPPHSIAS